MNNQNWKSVRKVRYYEDIKSALEYVTKSKYKEYSEDSFTKILIKNRIIRNNIIQKHYKKSIIKTRKAIYQTKFKITLPDTLTFLKEIKVFKIEQGIVVPLELTNKYKSINNIDDIKYLISYYVLNSKYPAYKNFLIQLIKDGKFIIPKSLKKRDKNFRNYINKNNYFTDVASFYTIRDILYELELINWYEDDEQNIMLYPTSSIINSNWNKIIILNKSDNIYYNKKIDKNSFIKNLVEVYLNNTNRRFTINADLIKIRDKICNSYKINDYYFKTLLLKYILKNKSYKISLNYGTIKNRKRNYDLKILSLPKLTANRLALYIRIERGVNE